MLTETSNISLAAHEYILQAKQEWKHTFRNFFNNEREPGSFSVNNVVSCSINFVTPLRVEKNMTGRLPASTIDGDTPFIKWGSKTFGLHVSWGHRGWIGLNVASIYSGQAIR